MSLYGALFSGVAGLAGQANKIGTISDNISNVNTVGYKSTEGLFETLVTNSGTIAYSPGGVLGRSRSSVSLQGLLQTTNSNTDVAISGNGFFVVNDQFDGSGTVSYTRAGSFRQDSTGNFANAAGYYLQGWPLDRNGLLPGEPGNTTNTTSSSSLESVETVNVSSFTGSAAATTSIEISANLQASQNQFLGAGATAAIDPNSSSNATNSGQDIIVPSVVNNLTRGDEFRLSRGNGDPIDVRYGGFTFSKTITSGAAGDSAVPTSSTTSLTLGRDPFDINTGSTTVGVRFANHGLQNGDVVTFSNVTATEAGVVQADLGGVAATEFNNSFVISNVSANGFDITISTTPTSDSDGGGDSVSIDFREFSGNILDATTATSTFLNTQGVAPYSTDALSFTISTSTVGTATFTYTSGTPSAPLGQFNSLTNLASAISATEGLTARVVGGQLYVSAEDANEAVTFANGSKAGSGSGSTLLRGIDWVGELGLKNIAGGTNRFATLQGLNDVVDALDGFSAAITNPDSDASVGLFVDDPLDTVTISDVPVDNTTNTLTASDSYTIANGSNVLTINNDSAHGYSDGDIINFNPTGITGYSTTIAAAQYDVVAGDQTVTVTDVGHGLTTGTYFLDMSNFTGYPNGNIGGVPIYEMHGVISVTVNTADEYEFEVPSMGVSNANVTSDVTAIATIGSTGIPMSDLVGDFEINFVNSTTYEITVATSSSTNANSATDLTGLVVGASSNGGSLTTELGLTTMTVPLNGSTLTAAQTTGALGPSYAATDATKNMASGSITPQYFTNIRVFDSLGTGHDIRVAFLKTGGNTWAAEVYAVPASDVSSSFANGQLAFGTVTFNGDGSLLSVDPALTAAIAISWQSDASDSAISLDWGTPGSIGTGDTDGMSQFDAAYRLNFANQNGVPVGELIGVEIATDGTVIARFSNGEEQSLYKIPLADFSNPNGLESNTGNVFIESRQSGTVNLREPGSSGVGTLQSSALESSNVELSEQLTSMIIAQRSYQANTKVITASDDLLEELNQTIR